MWDKFEGKIGGIVSAKDEESAEAEALIAASERGCTMVEAVEVAEVTYINKKLY